VTDFWHPTGWLPATLGAHLTQEDLLPPAVLLFLVQVTINNV
jgi:hypothetical protein